MAATFKSNPGFTPKSISGCKLWFDTDDASYTTTGTTVTAWTNKSGNANASTGVGTVSIGQATLNGKSSVRFPAGTNYLTVGAQSYSTSYRNVFFVVTVGPVGSKYFYLNCDDVICGQCYSWDDGDIELNKVGTLGLRTSTPTNFFNSTSIVSICTSSGGNTGIWVNGVNQTLANNNVGTGSFWSTGTTSVAIRLGGGTGMTTGTLDMYELLQYDGILTTAQREQIEAYLAQKWGLVSQMTDSHLSRRAVIYPSARKPTTTKPYFTQFSPKSIAGCAIWLDAADSTKITLSGSNVTQIVDKSDNAYIFTGSAGSYPTRTATLNGLPVISSATGQYLQTTSFNQNFLTATSFFVIRPTQNITGSLGYYAVFHGTVTRIIEIGVVSDGTNYYTQFNQSGTGFLYSDVIGFNIVNTTFLATSLVTGSRTTNQAYMNGSLNYTGGENGTISQLTSQTLHCIGRPALSFGYDFAEVIVYGTVLTTTQRQQVESYLSQKWGSTALLPTSHLNTTQPAGVPATVASVLAQIPRSIKAKRIYGYHRVFNPTPTVVSVRSFFGGGNYLYGIDVDRTGTYAYTVSRNGNDVNIITLATTSITRVGGGGGGGYAGPDGGNGVGGLYRATGLVIGDDGHIYIAEYASGRIRKLDLTTNVLSSVAGNPFGSEYQCNNSDGTGAAAGMCFPNDITYDSNHVLYFTESHRVRSCTRAGAVVTIAGSGTSGFVNDTGTAARFNGPYRIACDRVNNFLYIADDGNQVIRKYVISTGAVTTFATSTGSGSLLHCDEEGTLFVGNQSGGIRAYSSNGTYTTILNSSGYTAVGSHMDMVLSYDKKTIYIVRNDNVTVYELRLSTVVA